MKKTISTKELNEVFSNYKPSILDKLKRIKRSLEMNDFDREQERKNTFGLALISQKNKKYNDLLKPLIKNVNVKKESKWVKRQISKEQDFEEYVINTAKNFS